MQTELYGEQAQDHGVHAVDTFRYLAIEQCDLTQPSFQTNVQEGSLEQIDFLKKDAVQTSDSRDIYG